MKLIKDYIHYKIKYDTSFRNQLNKIKGFENLNESRLRELENEKLVTHLRQAYQKSKFYQKLYNEYGVNLSQIQSREDLCILPVISKELIRDSVADIYIGNRFRYKGSTSGTSGSPLTVYYSKKCINAEAAYLESFYNKAGFSFGDAVVSLRGKLDKTHLYHINKYTNVLYLSTYNLSNSNIDFFYKKIVDFSPKVILGYPSALENFCNLLLETKGGLSIPLAFTSSETLYSYQREKIEKTFCSKVYDLYGNAERSIMLTQIPQSSFYIEPPLYSINEFENSKILTTNIFNEDFPLIRYEVEDIVNFKDDKIASISGRSDDVLFFKDGGTLGSAALSLVFRGIDGINYSQVLQENKNSCRINIVTSAKYTTQCNSKLAENLEKYLGGKIKYSIVKVDPSEIVRSSSGKFKLIVSRL